MLRTTMNAAAKVGSVLWNCVKNGDVSTARLSSPDKCADAVNELFNIREKDGSGPAIPLVSGYQIDAAVARGLVGKSPLKRGPRG